MSLTSQIPYSLMPLRAVLRQWFDRASWQHGLSVLGGALIALSIYCLGHGLFTSAEINPLATLRWGFAHALGISLMLLLAGSMKSRSFICRFMSCTVVALLGAQLVSSSTLLISGDWHGLHGYESVMLYVGFGLVVCYLTAPLPSEQPLAVDFGRRKELISVDRIVAVHGAANYLELEVSDFSTNGIIRATLKQLLARYPRNLIQTHRSHLVNPSRVIAVEKSTRGGLILSLDNGSVVPVSARYADLVLEAVQFIPATADSSHRAG